MKYLVATLSLILTFSTVSAQYGNEWIDYDQTYYKFKTAKDGIYRLDYQTLVDAGIPLSNIDPRNIQIFNNGEEQFLWIEGEDDGKFNIADYIELFCSYNDGSMDKALYRKPEEQAHPYYSLYQDSTVYFLTWTQTVQGKRFKLDSDINFTGLTPDSYFMHQQPLYFTNQWLDGLPYADLGYFAEYTLGEGYHSGSIGGGSGSIFNILSPLYDSTGPDPTIDVVAFSASNPANYDNDGNNHEFEMKIGKGSQEVVLFSYKHRGYNKIEYKGLAVPKKAIGTTTQCRFTSILGSQGRHVVSLINLNYSRKYDLNNTSTFDFIAPIGNNFIRFDNYPTAKSFPIAYNLNEGSKYTPIIDGPQLKFKINASNGGRIVLSDETNVEGIDKLSPVRFNNYANLTQEYNYLIVTHSNLIAGASEYKKYRESSEGGSNTVLVIKADELYDEFYYGLHHPLALRNNLAFISQRQTNKPEFLLLLGKGLMYINYRQDNYLREHVDLVPTMGWPPTDYLFTSPLDQSDLIPSLATGRISALRNAEVLSYLEKVKEYERSPITTKNILQLAGGTDLGQNATFVGYLNQFSKIIAGDSFGGETILISKQSSITIDESLIDKITDEVNKGVHMVNYFGHGAAAVTEIDFGKVQNYQNKGKYPIYFFDGCILGNSYDNVPPLLEEFLFEPNKGAIAWVAGTFYSYSNELFNITNDFHRNAFKDFYGQPIGRILQETIRDYQNLSNKSSITHSRIMVLHGDPIIRLFSPDKPDYTVNKNSIKLVQGISSKDSFDVEFNLRNLGKVSGDTVPFVLSMLNSGKLLFSDTMQAVSVKGSLPMSTRMSKDFLKSGINRIALHIDPEDRISEFAPLGETNNYIVKDEFVVQHKLEILTPNTDIITAKPEIKVQFTTYQIPDKLSSFSISIDTTPFFNSGLLKTRIMSGRDILYEDLISLPPVDSTDYFLRVIDLTSIDTAITSFVFIFKSEPGFSQGYWEKFKSSQLADISYNNAKRKFEFKRAISSGVVLQTSGTDVVFGGGSQYDLPIYFGSVRHLPGLIVFAVDPDNESRYCENSQFNVINTRQWWPVSHPHYVIGGYSCLYRYNTNLPEHRDSLIAFLERVPDNYFLGIFNETTTGIDSWPEAMFSVLEKFGASKIRTLQENHPYILWGQKGSIPGSGTELMADLNNTITPPESQQLTLSRNMYPIHTNGQIISRTFGPASKWTSAWLREEHDHLDEFFIMDIIGINKDRREVDLIKGDTNQHLVDLASIDAKVYPHIKIRLNSSDEKNRTPLQPNRWTVLFDGLPEGFAYVEKVEKDTVEEGDSYQIKSVFRNISELPMDSLLVSTSQSANGVLLSARFDTLSSLNAGDTVTLNKTYNAMSVTGGNSFVVVYNPEQHQPEQDISNNAVNHSVYVKKNANAPLLEVYFDNQQILNGQVINPNARVSAVGRSNHKNLLITDPELYFVYFIKKGGTNGDTIIWSNSMVDFKEETPMTASRFDFSFDNLEAGSYIFLARLISPTEAEAGQRSEYTIEFEVADKNEITEILPYPNPMVNQCRFAYSFGGRELPQQYHLSIFNINGRLVREIGESEFGPLSFGNQLSEFVFDGKDNYGDQLANGVYLYKFEIKDVEKKQSSIDKYFEGGFGKIFISR